MYEVLRVVKFIKTETKMVVLEWEEGRIGSCYLKSIEQKKKKKYRASVLQDEKKYGDELRQWLHNSVSVCDITGL